MRTITTPDAPAAIGPYAQGTVVNGFLFTAGQIALDPATMSVVEGGITEQSEQVFTNLAAVLAAAGCSFADVVKTTVYLQSMD
ncbi:MAG: regulator, partial [Gemmatimonadetes bacterium HGW-Gemmatimonadetes-1]